MATKEDLQEVLVTAFEDIGVKTSKENAWKAFKACTNSIVEVCLKDPKLHLSLAGVGRYEILKCKPRKTKVGACEFIPRLRFKPSTRINEYLEEKMGQVPDPAKIAAARAAIVASGKKTSNLPPRVAKPKPETPQPAAPAVKAPAAAKAAPAKGKGKEEFPDNF